jgi:hypothetical protein
MVLEYTSRGITRCIGNGTVIYYTPLGVLKVSRSSFS